MYGDFEFDDTELIDTISIADWSAETMNEYLDDMLEKKKDPENRDEL